MTFPFQSVLAGSTVYHFYSVMHDIAMAGVLILLTEMSLALAGTLEAATLLRLARTCGWGVQDSLGSGLRERGRSTAMIETRDRQRPSRQAAAGPSSLLPLRAMEDVLTSCSSPGSSQPLPEFIPLVTSDRLGRGIMNGLAMSALIWASIAALIWQSLHP